MHSATLKLSRGSSQESGKRNHRAYGPYLQLKSHYRAAATDLTDMALAAFFQGWGGPNYCVETIPCAAPAPGRASRRKLSRPI